jgi:hypothetical protein
MAMPRNSRAFGLNAIWKFNKGQESPCSSQTFGCHDKVMVSSLCMDCSMGYDGLQICMGYESKVSDLFLDTLSTAPEKAM